jgi:pimeloyl-ACP methyl ester carboxylesterase
MRLAVRRPERLSALIVHNAVSHEDGLGPLWETRRALWSDRPRHEEALREDFFSPTATRQRHVGTNVANYPVWQQWLRETQPAPLVVWRRYDPSFAVAEAEAYRRGVPGAEVHVIDAGQFAIFLMRRRLARRRHVDR